MAPRESLKGLVESPELRHRQWRSQCGILEVGEVDEPPEYEVEGSEFVMVSTTTDSSSPVLDTVSSSQVRGSSGNDQLMTNECSLSTLSTSLVQRYPSP